MSRIARAIDRIRHRRVVRKLTQRADKIDALTPDHTRQLREQARALHAAAAKMIGAADRALGDGQTGTWLSALPPRTDWVHRPAIWTTPFAGATAQDVASGHGLGDNVTLHHDGHSDAISIRQIDGTSPAHKALVIDCAGQAGSFASLAIGLPDAARANLTKSALFRVDLDMDRPAGAEVFVRLNLRHGPNTEQVIHNLAPSARHAEFDIYYADLDVDDITDIWLDVIFNAPLPERVTLNDLVTSRRPRANL